MSLDEARRQILQMVAEKKITPAEAAELIGALEQPEVATDTEDPKHDWQAQGARPEPAARAPWESGEFSRDARDAAREAGRISREAARGAAQAGREAQRRLAEGARDATQRAKEAAREATREARHHSHHIGHELGGLGQNIANLVSNLVGKVGGVVGDFSIDSDGVAGQAVEFVDVLEGSFAAGPVSIDIQNANGAVELRAHDGDQGRLELYYRVKADNEAQARAYAQQLVRYSVDEHGIRFVQELAGGTFRLPATMSVRVVLHLPRTRTYGLDVKTKNGRVELDDLTVVGGRLETGNGRLEIRGVAGDRLDMSTGNGRIAIRGAVATLRAETGNGRIELLPQGGMVREWEAKTGNGSIDLNTRELAAEPAVEVRGRTGMGSVDLTAPGFEVREAGGIGSRRLEAFRPGTGEQRVQLELSTGVGSVNIE